MEKNSNSNDEIPCIATPLRVRISLGVFVILVFDFVESALQEMVMALANRIVIKMTNFFPPNMISCILSQKKAPLLERGFFKYNLRSRLCSISYVNQ